MYVRLLPAAIALLVLVGCSGSETKPTVAVEGTVTLKKKPVSGSVVFQSPETGKIFSGELDASGGYKIDEVEVGDYKVYIAPPQVTTAPEGPEDAKQFQKKKQDVPRGYQELATTNLTAKVEEGKDNKFPFELDPKGPPRTGPAQQTPPQ